MNFRTTFVTTIFKAALVYFHISPNFLTLVLLLLEALTESRRKSHQAKLRVAKMKLCTLHTMITLLTGLAACKAPVVPTTTAPLTVVYSTNFTINMNTTSMPAILISRTIMSTSVALTSVVVAENSSLPRNPNTTLSPDSEPSQPKSYWFLLYFIILVMWISVVCTWFGLRFEIRRLRNERRIERTPLLGDPRYETRELWAVQK